MACFGACMHAAVLSIMVDACLDVGGPCQHDLQLANQVRRLARDARQPRSRSAGSRDASADASRTPAALHSMMHPHSPAICRMKLSRVTKSYRAWHRTCILLRVDHCCCKGLGVDLQLHNSGCMERTYKHE